MRTRKESGEPGDQGEPVSVSCRILGVFKTKKDADDADDARDQEDQKENDFF
jgi:hypothetical protein